MYHIGQDRKHEVLIGDRANLDGFPEEASLPMEPMSCNSILDKQRELKEAAKATAKLPKPKGRPPAEPQGKAKAKAKGKSKAKAKPAPAASHNELEEDLNAGAEVPWLLHICATC